MTHYIQQTVIDVVKLSLLLKVIQVPQEWEACPHQNVIPKLLVNCKPTEVLSMTGYSSETLLVKLCIWFGSFVYSAHHRWCYLELSFSFIFPPLSFFLKIHFLKIKNKASALSCKSHSLVLESCRETSWCRCRLATSSCCTVVWEHHRASERWGGPHLSALSRCIYVWTAPPHPTLKALEFQLLAWAGRDIAVLLPRHLHLNTNTQLKLDYFRFNHLTL